LFIEIAIGLYQPDYLPLELYNKLNQALFDFVVGGLLYDPGNYLAAKSTPLKNQIHNHNQIVFKELS